MTDRSFIDQLAEVWSALIELGRELTPTEWDAPTECPGWSVRDQYSHVIGTESSLLGRPTPPQAAGGPHVHNSIAKFNEAWVEPRRSRPGAEIVDELEEVTAARLAALRAMTDEQLEAVGPSPIGEVPYVVFMSVRVMDCWVHEQDVRQALGRPWRFDGAAAPVAIDRLTSSFGYVVGKQVAPPEGTVVVLDIAGPLSRTLRLVVRDGRAVPADPGAEVSTHLTMPADLYVRLATGRVGPAAFDPGQGTIDGDRDLAEAVLAHLAQMP